MCIRDRTLLERLRSGEVLEIVEKMSPDDRVQLFDELPAKVVRKFLSALSPCLLYTSDAADDLLCVDLGGRRIIKKK